MVHLQNHTSITDTKIGNTSPVVEHKLHLLDQPILPKEQVLLLLRKEILLETRIPQAILLTRNSAKRLLTCQNIKSNLSIMFMFNIHKYVNHLLNASL